MEEEEKGRRGRLGFLYYWRGRGSVLLLLLLRPLLNLHLFMSTCILWQH